MSYGFHELAIYLKESILFFGSCFLTPTFFTSLVSLRLCFKPFLRLSVNFINNISDIYNLFLSQYAVLSHEICILVRKN